MTTPAMVAKFKIFNKETGVMSEPFGFGDLYGYEGEVNAVTLHHPFTNIGQDIDIVSHLGGNPAYPQVKMVEGANPNLSILLCVGVDEKGEDVYILIQD